MNNTETSRSTHLGFRLAVGAVGLGLLALFVMLGSVALKQSATTHALQTPPSVDEEAPATSARD